MRILTIALGWDSALGGQATVNRELSIGMAAAGHQVVALVPRPTGRHPAVDVRWPRSPADVVTGNETRDELFGKQRRMLREADDLPDGIDLVVGHSRFTSDLARQIRDERYPNAKVVHLVHSSPEEGTRARFGDGISADRFARNELELMRRSDLVVGVGPLIADEMALLAQRERLDLPVHEMVPGIVATDPPHYRTGQRRFEVLVTGRADDPLKGVANSAAITAELNRRGLPVHLVVRGVPPDQLQQQQIEMNKITGYSARLRPYTVDPAELLRDLNGADLVLMPSQHEGFGLVASEAAGGGVPVLMNRHNTGMGLLLSDPDRVPPQIGLNSTVVAASHDIDAWADRCEQVLGNLPAERERALRLREHLTGTFSWQAAGSGIVEAAERLRRTGPDQRVVHTATAGLVPPQPGHAQDPVTRQQDPLGERPAHLRRSQDTGIKQEPPIQPPDG